VSLQAWLLFCVTEAVLCVTPGPAVLLVVSMSLTASARAGFGAALGILAANAFYFVLSATGIGAVLVASSELFFLIKWAGALYLIVLGIKMLFSHDGGIASGQEEQPAEAARAAPPGTAMPRRAAAFTHGLVTQGANPKAIVFFTSLLPQFIDPAAGVPGQIAILGISSILIELVVLSLYIAACHRARYLMRRPGPARALNRSGGLLLIGAGAGLAALRRA